MEPNHSTSAEFTDDNGGFDVVFTSKLSPAVLISQSNAIPLEISNALHIHRAKNDIGNPQIPLTSFDLSHLHKPSDSPLGVHIFRSFTEEGVTMQSFYREHLLSEKAKTQTIALIVSFDDFHKLFQCFPNMKVLNFESSTDFYYAAYGRWCHDAARIVYDLVIDSTSDKDLWECDSFPVLEDTFTIDVILNPKCYGSVEYPILQQLAELRWERDPNWQPCFGGSPYRRRQDPPIDSPNFIVSPMYQCTTYRLPSFGGGCDIVSLHSVAKEAQEVINRLQSVANGCGWFTGTPTVTILNFHTDVTKSNVLCEPGTEYLYPLSVRSDQVIDWILSGEVKSGKVLLVKCRIDLDRHLNKDIDNKHRGGKNDETKEAIYATGATHVVFYGNNASSNSPRDVVAYHKWLRSTHPESRQCCLLLEKGINGMFNKMFYGGFSDEDVLRVFYTLPLRRY